MEAVGGALGALLAVEAEGGQNPAVPDGMVNTPNQRNKVKTVKYKRKSILTALCPVPLLIFKVAQEDVGGQALELLGHVLAVLAELAAAAANGRLLALQAPPDGRKAHLDQKASVSKEFDKTP